MMSGFIRHLPIRHKLVLMIMSTSIVVLLLAMMVMKFFLVASWFMHLRTDQPVFKRLFVVGAIAAPVLYLVVLATLHGVLAD